LFDEDHAGRARVRSQKEIDEQAALGVWMKRRRKNLWRVGERFIRLGSSQKEISMCSGLVRARIAFSLAAMFGFVSAGLFWSKDQAAAPNFTSSPVARQQPSPTPNAENKNPQHAIELNTVLMQSTFMLVGRTTDPNKFSFATGFIIGRPVKGKSNYARYVLITAAHVFESFTGRSATILLRRQKSDASYEKLTQEFEIRDASNKPLWMRHPDSDIDVAAMYVALPDDVKFDLVPTPLLSNDDVLNKFEIHPGDELFALGFPLGVSSPEGGFPILRSGKIASYPLVPAKKMRSFLFDFQVYDGNSGGPVYFVQSGRYYGGSHHLGETIHFIIGLVTAQATSRIYNNQPVYLAQIVPAEFILETVNLLPEPQN
jgi:Trypsin-like peptidase domain